MNFYSPEFFKSRMYMLNISVFFVWMGFFLIFIFFDVISSMKIIFGSSVVLFVLVSCFCNMNFRPLKKDTLAFRHELVIFRYSLFLFPFVVIEIFGFYEEFIIFLSEYSKININSLVVYYKNNLSNEFLNYPEYFDVIVLNNYMLFLFSFSYFFSTLFGFGFYWSEYSNYMKISNGVFYEKMGFSLMKLTFLIMPCFFLMLYVCYFIPWLVAMGDYIPFSSFLFSCVSQVVFWSLVFLFLQSLVFNFLLKVRVLVDNKK